MIQTNRTRRIMIQFYIDSRSRGSMLKQLAIARKEPHGNPLKLRLGGKKQGLGRSEFIHLYSAIVLRNTL